MPTMVSLTGHLKSYAPLLTASPANATSESALHYLVSESFYSILSKRHTIAYIILDYPPRPDLTQTFKQLQVLATTS